MVSESQALSVHWGVCLEISAGRLEYLLEINELLQLSAPGLLGVLRISRRPVLLQSIGVRRDRLSMTGVIRSS